MLAGERLYLLVSGQFLRGSMPWCMTLGVESACLVQIPVLFLSEHLTLGTFVDLSKLHLLTYKMGDNDCTCFKG